MFISRKTVWRLVVLFILVALATAIAVSMLYLSNVRALILPSGYKGIFI